ncbi:MAG: hypothetical protein QMC90_02670 [Dehalococcoidales bacterium]|nr:hypothetical protein [Dehalococcoidales bacterium]
MKWSFIVNITTVKDADIGQIVEDKASEVVSAVGKSDELSAFRVLMTFYQKRDRWLVSSPEIPREDKGRDLDNLVKPVLDGLGPIIGSRIKWEKDEATGKFKPAGKGTSTDARITEIVAKKVNSGSNEEFLSIEVESIRS